MEAADQSIPEGFSGQVARYPERTAVKTKCHHLTYRALDQAADRLAQAILAHDRQPESPVALLLEHDAPMIVGVLGALKAAKIAMPLDPSLPQARMSALLADSQTALIVTNGRNRSMALRVAGAGHRLIDMDALDSALVRKPVRLSIPPGALAYLLYTSGSTGPPKGVLQTHRNIIRSVLGYTNGFGITPADRLTLLASCGTGQGVSTAFSALLNGAALCLLDVREAGLDALAAWLDAERITIYRSAATIFRHLTGTLTGTREFPSLRLVSLGSEPVSQGDVELCRRYFSPRCVFVNGLSTSETLNFSQCFIDKETAISDGVVPVGYAVEGMEALLLDEAGGDVGVGQVGEIAVKSRFLSPGYWRRPDLTRATFLDVPGAPERIYRTGDLGRRRRDGSLEHLGRKDFRVKIRGFRVELEEVESVLTRHPGVRGAAVEVQSDDGAEARLVAYVVAAPGHAPTITELREYLTASLPLQAVPSAFVVLDAVPLTLNGKIDRRALAAQAGRRPRVGAPFVAPRTPVEEALARIWTEVLRIDRVGVHDNFFDLGGHSLLASRITSRLQATLGVALPLPRLFEAPTVAELVLEVVAHQAAALGAEGVDELFAELEPPSPSFPTEPAPEA